MYTTGSYGGLQPIVIDGSGFSDGMMITVCGDICSLNGTISSTQVVCLTPPNSGT